ncbi:MAG: hypothetical protein CL779_00250 [Chloroflexi bacterium]|nr:hypothetical protein [Chloroflexota bacterium]|tara:strand:- start:41 stop:499 length:459 start_codon:yes stop_codon:yes gene_type:complete
MNLNKLRNIKSPLTFILLISAIGLYAVIHGYMNPPKISIEQFDAGSISNFDIGDVIYYQDQEFYLVGMRNGKLRALKESAKEPCSLNYFGSRHNNDNKIKPLSLQNIFFDNCDNLWHTNGDSFFQNQVPLKTLFVNIDTSTKDERVIVEVTK